MRQAIISLVLGLAVLVTAGCGFHPRGTTQVPDDMKTLILDSSDPYGPLNRSVREQLRLNGVTIVEKDTLRTDLPSLRVLGSSVGRDVASIFRSGTAAEYQLVMHINAQVLIPNKGIFPISSTVYRSFFDNPQRALAKDSEQQIIQQEMRDRAAEQLVRKLLTVHAAEEQLNSRKGTSDDPVGLDSTPGESPDRESTLGPTMTPDS
ncbi:LPS assembly lipoprotein LptE [Enterobacterales bacterium CwR94]|nr:LPS assembly lipoprotein LptE [Enterobacterales bacterium CwR94]